MTAARQASPTTTPMRRRQDRELPTGSPGEPVQREKIRYAVVRRGLGWMQEYRDGKATWGSPSSAALFSDEKAADAIARELHGYTTMVFLKHDAEVPA